MISQLVDIGLNLTHDSFDHDRAALIARAQAAGVGHMIVTGSSLESSAAAIALVRGNPTLLRATAGIHPHHAAAFRSDQRSALMELLSQPEVIATGECGLDFFRNFSPHTDQERVFRLQLELACEAQKPLFLHQRDAHDAFVAILREYLPRTAGGVAHCFTADMTEARHYLDMGLYIGITGWICDERRGRHLREVVKQLPLDRLVVETDAPYLLPRDLPKDLVHKPTARRNEPMYLSHIVQTIADCRHQDVRSIAEAATSNTRTLFGWPKAA